MPCTAFPYLHYCCLVWWCYAYIFGHIVRGWFEPLGSCYYLRNVAGLLSIFGLVCANISLFPLGLIKIFAKFRGFDYVNLVLFDKILKPDRQVWKLEEYSQRLLVHHVEPSVVLTQRCDWLDMCRNYPGSVTFWK